MAPHALSNASTNIPAEKHRVANDRGFRSNTVTASAALKTDARKPRNELEFKTIF
jgi:hypothetical protein